ncbi:outer membrane beta-barrel protein [Helicobacter aurati]|uniref:Outer membrane beta-barrel protein n=1 Tax=Helicobacter aurati TaxID=137778 RepID=A0A3D8J0Z4_9HELI|nr:outer membrane beta-barrel protein [Helicobacter aurati]RDU70845.1 outer membrane beta-barrel protein [Helicobacter aurati]
MQPTRYFLPFFSPYNRFVTILLSSALLIMPLKAEDKGWFLGLNLGGSLATSASFQRNNANNSGSIMLSTGVSFGGKLGYQAFFTKNSGMRFYLSGITTFGVYPDAVNPTNSDMPLVIDFYILGDINADYLFNWVNGSNYSSGFFIGFFGGALTAIPLENPNPMASHSIGITAGINLGIRSTMNLRHQIEFGVKGGMAMFFGDVTDANGVNSVFTNIGGLLYAGAGYLYKF